jgi:hypothetical protein
MFGGAGDVTSFPLSSIQTAGLSGVLEKKLKVRAGSTELVFKASLMSSSMIGSGDVDLKAVSNLLQRAVAGEPLGTPDQTVAKEPPPPVPSGASDTWLDELERLAKREADAAFARGDVLRRRRRTLPWPMTRKGVQTDPHPAGLVGR